MPRVPSSEGCRFRLRGELGGKAVEFVLADGANAVGSAVEAEVALPVREVSRRHAVLQVGDHGVSVEDLDSKNGTFVNGVRVRRAALKHGDWLQLGPVILTVEAVAADELELGIPLASARSSSQSVGRVKDATTDLGVARHAPVPWSEALAAFGRCVLRPAEPDIAGALAALAGGLDTEPVVLLSCRPGEDVLVREIVGEVAGLDTTLTPQALHAALATARAGDDIASAFLDGDRPLVLAGRAVAGDWPTVLAVGGRAATPDLRPVLTTALRMLDHAHPGDDETDVGGPRAAAELAFPVGHVICPSLPMQAVYRQLELLLAGRMPVLVTGETGVGKEHVVRILHASSDRADAPLEIVNCAAIPSELLEAELFGIEEGIATGVKAREGCFRRANGGIVFLDEIGDMPPALQAKLLRTLQDGEVQPVGARRPARIDVRVVTATNTDLEQRMLAGSFRRDLSIGSRAAGWTFRRCASGLPTSHPWWRTSSSARWPRPAGGCAACRWRPWPRCPVPRGRATCASSRTRSGAWSSSARTAARSRATWWRRPYQRCPRLCSSRRRVPTISTCSAALRRSRTPSSAKPSTAAAATSPRPLACSASPATAS